LDVADVKKPNGILFAVLVQTVKCMLATTSAAHAVNATRSDLEQEGQVGPKAGLNSWA
jgi:hypothetical protein